MYHHHWHASHPYAHAHYRGWFRGRLFWFAIGAFAGVWWMKKHQKDNNWVNDWRRREMVTNVPQRPILRTDHEADSDRFEVVAKGVVTDADRARLRELGSQATEIV
jgi:hypothetical protein